MLKKSLIYIICICMSITLFGCSKNTKKRYSAEFLELFNTASQIIGYAESEDEFAEYTQYVYNTLYEYHKLYDIYDDFEGINNIKTINDNAGIAPVKVDQKIIDLLLFGKEMYDFTDGKVNIAMGAVLEIWHEYRTVGTDDPENAKLPPMDVLKEKSNHIDINKMIINEEESTVYLEDKEMSLDVGSIAKGYATEQVSQLVLEKGFNSALYSIGGNVRAIGLRNENEPKWNVGVQNPELDSENDYLEILSITELSLVTSGVYQRYYTVDGKEYHHIIDGDTLMPSDYFTAVSIVCKDSGVADALSTAIFNMPYEKGIKFIENLDNTEALWVFKDGTISYSSGFDKLIKETE